MDKQVWLILALAACGDDGPSGPRKLVADPAVETGCAPGVAEGKTRAKVVACKDELVRGRLAAGRVGDFVLENARVRVIIRGPGEGYYLQGTAGGGLVDAAPIGGEDLVKEIVPSVDLAVGGSDEIVITEAGDDGPAELVVRGPAQALDLIAGALNRDAPPVIVEHHYRLRADRDELELETIAYAGEPDAEAPTLYDAVFVGGRAAAFTPPDRDVIATTGTTSSYALVYPAGAASPQLLDVGGIRLVTGPSLDFGKGQLRYFVIGDGSVSSVTGRAWELAGREVGTVRGTSAPGVDIEVTTPAGVVTIARTDAAGAFAATVPAGAYTLRATGAGRAPGPDVSATVTEGAEAAVAVTAGASGTLSVTVTNDAGAPLPARVLIEQAGADRRIEYVGASGQATIPIAPGTWRVSISRGLEYDAFVASSVVIGDGQTASLNATLDRVVDTAGWISLDTHLHSELSTDSTLPIDDRLRAVAAEGVEVPVSTDHDMIVDYAPVIIELGLADWLTSMIGAETSSLIWGHINAFPQTPDPAKAAAGAARWVKRSPGQVLAELRAPGRIVQVNHPREDGAGLFDAIDLDPVTLRARKDPSALGLPPGTDLSDLGFDAMEVANGSSAGDFDEVFRDYLAMVAAGHGAAATGSSDSHGATAYAGESRTFVYVGAGADDPATVDPAAIVAAIKARRVTVGSGAFVTANIGSAIPGDTANVTGLAQVTLHVKVQAAAWQPLQTIRIYQGRTEVRTIALDPQDTAVVRYDADVLLPPPAEDTFYVVRVERAGEGPPVVTKNLPAFTNPIFVQVD